VTPSGAAPTCAGPVIRYSYLWRREHLQGRDEGQKDRPCAIVASIRNDDAGDTRVLVLPVTHSPPEPSNLAVEMPPKVKRRQRLDGARSWVVLTEWNELFWPGLDLRPTPGATDGSIAYGLSPTALFVSIRDQVLTLVQGRVAVGVPRP
jgi:hypothetical protein